MEKEAKQEVGTKYRKRSGIGTENTEIPTRYFNSKDICSIIRVAGEFNVSKIVFDGIEIVFNGADPHKQSKTSDWKESSLNLVEAVESPGDMRNEEARQLYLSQLMIEDPVAYENMMVDGQVFEGFEIRGQNEATGY